MAPILKFSGVNKTNFKKVDNNLATNISSIDNVELITQQPGTIVQLLQYYNFRGENIAESGHDSNQTWRPSTNMFSQGLSNSSVYKSWRNHNTPTDNYYNPDLALPGGGFTNYSSLDIKLMDLADNVSAIPDALQLRFNFVGSDNSNIKGWGLASGPTPSVATGPTGGAQGPYLNSDGTVHTAEISNLTDFNSIPFNNPNTNSGSVDSGASNRYIYPETTSHDEDDFFVCCFHLSNVRARMSNPNNLLKLKFMTHGAGNDFGKLSVLLQSADAYNEEQSSAGGEIEIFPRLAADNTSTSVDGGVNLKEVEELAHFNAAALEAQHNLSQTSDYVHRDIDLASVKTRELADPSYVHHWIYFVYGNATNYDGDLAIDNVRIEEIVP